MKSFTPVIFLSALLSLVAGGAVAATSGDSAAGKALASKQCISCHGPDGAGGATGPVIRGLSGDHITNQLQAFKSGARKSMMMEMVAKRLTDKDIADLSAYFSTN